MGASRHIGRRARRAITAALLALPLVVASPAADAGPPTKPSEDPFYTYSGSAPLSSISPGTVLNHRKIQLSFGAGNSTPVNGEQLLYRTTGQLGEPTVTVTTVLVPPTAPIVSTIVGYLSFYDGLGSQCDPSYTLAGGDPGDAPIEQQAQEEALLISWYLAHGNVVTVPDFEGTGLHWMAGRESGYGTLDAIRATESFLGTGADTRVALSGYSGGSVAANWANELAPSYSSEVNLVGVAEAGIPANYFNHFAYIDGTAEYSAAIPGELIGLTRAYGIDLTRYVTPFGLDVVRQESDACIASMFGKFPGLTISDIMLPEYRDLDQTEPFASMLREQTMGSSATRPAAPVFMAIGNADGTGDGAMVAADVKALARQYCEQGLPVLYQEYQGADHLSGAALFEPQTGPYLQALLSGLPPADNCALLDAGLPQA
jgi:hypothetical protein